MASHLQWLTVEFGMWYIFVRMWRCNPRRTLFIALCAHLGEVMLAGGVTPDNLLDFLLQQTCYYSRKPSLRDPGSPVAILIILLRLSDPEMFAGKLSRRWRFVCFLLFYRPIFFICRLTLDVHNHLVVEADLTNMYREPSALALHVGSALLLSVLIAGFSRCMQNSMTSYESTKPSELTTGTLTIASPAILAPGHFPLTPPPNRKPVTRLRFIKTDVKPNGSKQPASSASLKPSLKATARPPLQLDVDVDTQDEPPSLWSPPALYARLRKGVRSPRVVPKLPKSFSTRPPSPSVSSVDDEEYDFRKDASAAPKFPSTTERNITDEGDVSPPGRKFTPSSPIVPEHNPGGDSDGPVHTRATTSHFEGDGDDEDPWRAAATAKLSELSSRVGPCIIEAHHLQHAPDRHSAEYVDRYDRLGSETYKVLRELRVIRLDMTDDLRQFCDDIVDEAERLLKAYCRLKRTLGSPMSVDEAESLLQAHTGVKPTSLGSPTSVDDPPVKLAKPEFPDGPQQTSRRDLLECLSPEDQHSIQELELGYVERELKRCDGEIGRLTRINEVDLPLEEKESCSRFVADLETALRKLTDMELYIEKDLEVRRERLEDRAKSFVRIFQSFRGDDRSQEDADNDGRKIEGTLQSEQLPPSHEPQPEENAVYGGPETAFAASFRIPVFLKRVHLQCKVWDDGPPREVTRENNWKVTMLCENLIRTSRYVDLLSKLAKDDDLKRLPDNLFTSTPQMLQDIFRVLRALRQDYSLLVDQGLPCARNISTELESLGRRKEKYQKWIEDRKVHFAMAVEPPSA